MSKESDRQTKYDEPSVDDSMSEVSSVTGNNVPPSLTLSQDLEVVYSQETNINLKKKRAFSAVVETSDPIKISNSQDGNSTRKEALEHGLIIHGLLQRSHANFGVGDVGLTMLQLNGLGSLKAGSTNSILSLFDDEAIKIACQKYFAECPPFVHFSAKDSAPSSHISIGPTYERLSVDGGMRGYRMARASHGVDAGSYYYEIIILDPEKPMHSDATNNNINNSTSSISSIKDFQLPPSENLRTGSKLETALKQNDESGNGSVAGHVRIGWSMRTGDLQAPVGYDKWSYALRDIKGSKVHASRREDNWGGLPFGPGDVIGLAINLNAEQIGGINLGLINDQQHAPQKNDNTPPKKKNKKLTAAKNAEFTNHIRFFKNGIALGPGFIYSRAVRSGCEAFNNIESGVYCPAVSTYMGARIRANFGPHFVYTIPPAQLPTGMVLRAMSERCPSPISADEALQKCMTDKALTKKTDDTILNAFKKVIRAEVNVRNEVYSNFMKKHVEEIKAARLARRISVADFS